MMINDFLAKRYLAIVVLLLVIVFMLAYNLGNSNQSSSSGGAEVEIKYIVLPKESQSSVTNKSSPGKKKIERLREMSFSELKNVLVKNDIESYGINLETFLYVLESKLTVENYEEYLAAMAAYPENHQVIKAFLQSSVDYMYSKGVEHSTILEFIVGSGLDRSQRTNLIHRVFSMSKKDIAFMARSISKLEESDRMHACVGVKGAIATSNTLDDYLDVSSIVDHRIKEQVILGYGQFINNQLNEIGSREDKSIFIASIAEKLSNSVDAQSKEQLSGLISSMAKVFPEEAMSLIEALTKNSDVLSLIDNDTRLTLISSLVKIKPRETLSTLLSNPATTSSDLESAFSSWTMVNKSQAVEWLKENIESSNPEVKNVMYTQLATITPVNAIELKTSWEYVNKITDPALKKQAEGQVWGKERDMVRNTVNAAPQKAIEELVSGKSQHDSYWIEEAMDVWMAKDFDNAEKWYQDNWKNLPADKAQYAAASFAKQAIKTGDLDVAEQWLPYIKDPKTKERIQAEVSKAAGE